MKNSKLRPWYMSTSRTVIVPPISEFDIKIVFPGGKRNFLLQYRNYEGNMKTGEGASFDLILDQKRAVHNWVGTGMQPARGSVGNPHIRFADQLLVVL